MLAIIAFEINGVQIGRRDLPAGTVVGSWFEQSNLVTGQRSNQPRETGFSNPKCEFSLCLPEIRSGRKTVVERQKRMPAEGDDDRLFLARQHRRCRSLWTRSKVRNRGGDPVASSQSPQARLTILYRSTDRLSRRGAPVKNLVRVSRMCTIKSQDQASTEPK